MGLKPRLSGYGRSCPTSEIRVKLGLGTHHDAAITFKALAMFGEKSRFPPTISVVSQLL